MFFQRFGATLLATFAVINGAQAADLPAYKTSTPAPSIFSWTGCYLGIHGGGGTMLGGSGAIAGGQLGCNYQTGRIVIGIEGEGYWSGITNVTNFSSTNSGFTSNSSNRVENRWDADLAIRLGFTPFDLLLVYGKAGVAIGEFSIRNNSVFSSSFFSSENTQTGEVTSVGPIVGIGTEFAFSPNWSAKVEYNYIRFLNKSTTLTSCTTGSSVCSTHSESFSVDKHLLKAGLNYRF